MLHSVIPKMIGSVDGREHERVGGLLLPARPLWPAMLTLLPDQRAGQCGPLSGAGLGFCSTVWSPGEEDLAHGIPLHPAHGPITPHALRTPCVVLHLKQEPGRFSWTTAWI